MRNGSQCHRQLLKLAARMRNCSHSPPVSTRARRARHTVHSSSSLACMRDHSGQPRAHHGGVQLSCAVHARLLHHHHRWLLTRTPGRAMHGACTTVLTSTRDRSQTAAATVSPDTIGLWRPRHCARCAPVGSSPHVRMTNILTRIQSVRRFMRMTNMVKHSPRHAGRVSTLARTEPCEPADASGLRQAHRWLCNSARGQVFSRLPDESNL